MHLGCGASFGVWDASSSAVAAYAVTARGAARAVGKLSTTMTTDPDGKPYAHNAEQAEAHKQALADGDGPVSNETARAYLAAYRADNVKLRAALTACHSAMLGKVHPKHPAWGVLFAAQDSSPNNKVSNSGPMTPK